MVQSNSVADAALSVFSIPPWVTGVVMAGATAAVILGGIQSVGRVAGVLVPIMIVFYMVAGFVALARNLSAIPGAFELIFANAFTPTAAAGGFLGATVMRTVQMGVARGVFSNESGLGSSPIAAAAAQTRNPVTQGMVSMTQTFIDTIVVCTMTGLVILTTGVWTTGATGASLTTDAFAIGLPGENVGAIVVAVGLMLFAYSTLLGWSYYGEKAMSYLFGERVVTPYRVVFCVLIAVGAVAKLDLVWTFADVMNGLMAVPNLIGLIGLAGVVAAETEATLGGGKGDRRSAQSSEG
jgi:AGCS family alanine or glycine:cation symporter